ncbi:MAG: glycosyltransferase family 2 protein [Alistipes sp.]|nr:glycosyltransferase family 2 protein [Alistipes sp.]MBR6662972.1 glycosyltransferase family 2 protein [Alistipes sp.]
MTATSIISEFSVVIPLYNKAAEIERTLGSVLRQSVKPREIIVVDDGSTDGSAEIVERMASPIVRLVRQANAGVSAARNRAIEMATGRWIALLDGDDWWREDYLLQMARLIERYPDCGAYGSGFYVDNGRGLVVGDTPQIEGVVNFFEESMRRYVLIPSATIVRRDLVMQLGGFPVGMRMGEDQYLWTRIARVADVAFTPTANVVYLRAASNRSASIYRPEQSEFSLEDLYDESASEISNEYVARVALGKALVESVRGGTQAAQRALEFFSYNKMSHRIARKVRFFNSLPVALRPTVSAIYNWLAWAIARKGI